MKKNNLSDLEKSILEKFLDGDSLTESENITAKALMVEHHLNEMVFNMLVSGVVIKEHLPLYKKLLEYGDSDKCKFLDTYESSIEVEEARSIIKDIEEGKEFSKDCYGRELQIISADLFNKEKVYLIKDYGKLFRISQGKGYNELFNDFTDRFRVNDRVMFICKDLQEEEDEASVILYGSKIDRTLYHPLGAMIKGRVVITGMDIDNEWDGTRSLNIDEATYIMSHAHMWGSVRINIDFFYEDNRIEDIIKNMK